MAKEKKRTLLSLLRLPQGKDSLLQYTALALTMFGSFMIVSTNMGNMTSNNLAILLSLRHICDDQKQTDTGRNGQDQRHVRYGRHLMGQHGEIRFRDRDKCPDEQSYDDHIDRFLKRYDRFSDAFPHWLHRHVGTKRKQSHADDQQHGAGQKLSLIHILY